MAFEGSLNEFLTRCDGMTEEKYHKEFMSLKVQSQRQKEKGTYPAETGQMPCNKKKNRFKDILPFEYTRVSLHPVEGVEGSDYINANYITGIDDKVTYIAAQGPLPTTVCDFWRMLWYHSIEIVVMACKVVENAKPKCECYWPDKNTSRDFSGIYVTTTEEDYKSDDFVVRDFLVECAGEKQQIRQYHYTAWPDHGKPTSSEPIIKMLEMVHDFKQNEEIPLLFHCSAGCGRTGTMIAIDISRTMFANQFIPDKFSIHGLVEKMRKQRPSMVQAKDQYQFVYEAVYELARRALGFNPTLPVKPVPSTKVIPEYSDGVYENTAASPLPPSVSPDIGPADSEDRISYVNTPTPIGPASSDSSPDPSPPVTRRPVARQRSASSKSSTSSQEKPYENLTTLKPVPSAKPNREPPVLAVKPVLAKEQPQQPAAVPPSPKPRPRNSKNRENAPLPAPKPTPSPKPKPVVASEGKSPTQPKKSLPPLPPHRTRGDKSSATDTPVTSTPIKPGVENPEGPYSAVDMSQITDTGPEISVVDEQSGKQAPLEQVMSKAGDDANSSSIMDTFLSMLDDDMLKEAESKEKERLEKKMESSPPPPLAQRTQSMNEEPPPAIPRRTEASLFLVEETEPAGPGDYDVVRAENGGADVYEMVSTEPLPNTRPALKSDYEAPTLLSKPVVLDEPPPLPALPPERKKTPSKSPSTEFLQTSTSLSPGNGGSSPKPSRGSSTRNKLTTFTRLLKKDKKKPSATEISGPVGAQQRMARSPSEQAMSSGSTPSTSSRPSPSHSITSVNSKYYFPGELGYGIRICKPSGPRQEPNTWKVRTLTNSVA